MHIVGQAFSTFSLWNWANTISDTYCTFSYLTDVLFDNLPVKIWEKRILVLYSRKYPLCPVGHAQLQQSLITLKYVHTWYTNLEDSLRILHSQSFRLRVDYTYVKYEKYIRLWGHYIFILFHKQFNFSVSDRRGNVVTDLSQAIYRDITASVRVILWESRQYVNAGGVSRVLKLLVILWEEVAT